MKILLNLYPRRWRARYQKEVELLLEAEPRSLRLALDLCAGAIDAQATGVGATMEVVGCTFEGNHAPVAPRIKADRVQVTERSR